MKHLALAGCIMAIALQGAVVIVEAAQLHWLEAQSRATLQRVLIVPPTRPERCRPFYTEANDKWIDCMGVGYK